MQPTRSQSQSVSEGIPDGEPEGTADRTIDAKRGSLLSAGLVALLAAVVTVPYLLLWGGASIQTSWESTSGWLLIGMFFVGVVVHELIHGLTWMGAGRLRWSEIAFGVHWEVLAPFAHAKVPVGVNAYRIGTAMPGIVLGLIPTAVAFVLGAPLLFLFGACFLCLAAGDALILIMLRGAPGGSLVQDHPTRFGCRLVAGPRA